LTGGPSALREDNYSTKLARGDCAACGTPAKGFNDHGDTSSCPHIPQDAGGAGTQWGKGQRLRLYSDGTYKINKAGESAKDANPGKGPPDRNGASTRLCYYS
jgi:hypothetical protein